MDYAAAVLKPGRPPSNPASKTRKKTPQGLQKSSFRLPVPDQAMAKICDMERRTLVLRKVPPSTTTVSILKDLKDQIQRPLGEVIEAVAKEPLDYRRFYVRFHTVELKRECAKQGFNIGNIKIPPQLSDVQGYIPDVPHYLDTADVLSFLSRYGDVVKGDFEKFEDTGIRCGVFRFELNLHPNVKLPGIVHINSDSFSIFCKDDILQCAYCDKYGHRAIHCLKKKEDVLKKAQKELAAQVGGYYQTGHDGYTDVAFNGDPTATSVPSSQSSNTPLQTSSASIPSTSSPFVPTQALSSRVNVAQSVQNVLGRGSETLRRPPTLTQGLHNTVSFVQSENLTTVSSAQSTIMSTSGVLPNDSEESPMEVFSQESLLQSTAELKYPSSFEQRDNNVSSSDESNPPSKRALHVPESKDLPSSIVMKPTYYVKPAEYKPHEVEPYHIPETKFAAFIEPLNETQVQRMEALKACENDPNADGYEEYQLLCIQQTSNQEWMRKLSDSFRKNARKRWNIHYRDILARDYPDNPNPKLGDDARFNVFLECISLVRADVEQTHWFKTFWYELCEHNKLFNFGDIAVENA